MDKNLNEQAKHAFEFVEKLYFEISYLIKEIEGNLQSEGEKFTIARPSGYAVTTKTSAGLEAINVANWFPRTFSVFFIPSDFTRIIKGQSITPFAKDLKIIFLHINLIDSKETKPIIIMGVLTAIKTKRSKTHSKFEHLMGYFPYNHSKIFASAPKIDHEDPYCSFEGKCFSHELFKIKSSEHVKGKLVDPVLEIFRK